MLCVDGSIYAYEMENFTYVLAGWDLYIDKMFISLHLYMQSYVLCAWSVPIKSKVVPI
jgi:hypothetical protein